MVLPGRTAALIRQRKRTYCCSLIYKVPVLRWPGATARYPSFNVPVETGTPPRRRRKLHIARFRLTAKARSFRCSSFPNQNFRFDLVGWLRHPLRGDFSVRLSENPGGERSAHRWEIFLLN